ncbi:hypothetical protein TNCV_813981 [Trichonephila clavipes]|nr:hypothetical protein TNCV_813981 [Trichonephila clavipes]
MGCHLARMNEDRYSKKIFLAKPMGNRPRGRPPLRWIDCVEKDLKILKVEYWKKVAKMTRTTPELASCTPDFYSIPTRRLTASIDLSVQQSLYTRGSQTFLSRRPLAMFFGFV